MDDRDPLGFRHVRRFLGWLVAVGLLLVPRAGGAQETSCDAPGDVEVRRLQFVGNVTFPAAALSDGIVTTASSWTRRWLRFLGTRRCLDAVEFANDLVRLQIYYRNHGFASVAVDTTVVRLAANAVEIRFTIREGIPTLVDTLRVLGLDAVPERDRLIASLPIRAGGPFDKYALQQSIDSVTRRLRNGGYPSGEVFFSYATDTARHRATVEIDVAAGTRATVGSIALTVVPTRPGDPAVSEARLRELLGVKPGQLYRESALERAKRTLYQTDIFRTVAVDIDSADVVPPGDSLVDVRIALTEALTKSRRVGGGYGTLDCFRTEGEYVDANLFGAARRLEVRGRVSKIGIGRPLGGVPEICPTLRQDPYSERLNYYAGASVVASTDRLGSWRPSVTLYSERRSEFNAYLRDTPLGLVTNATRQVGRRTFAASYQLEYGRTVAQPAVFCALQSVCTEADRDPFLRFRRLGVIGASVTQDWSDAPANPTRGGVARLELRSALSELGSDARVEFSRGTADLALYLAVRRGVVLALRGRAGVVAGPAFRGSSEFVPPQERLFAGGPTSVRGFEQSDLGPKVYITQGYDTVRAAGATGPIGADEVVFFRAADRSRIERPVPTGGSALLVGNVELRLPFPVLEERLQWTMFADAGELWTVGASQAKDRFQGMKVTPGVGLRVGTPFGVVRLDIAYNRYAQRTGAAYYDAPFLAGGQLYCVSPGNTLAVTGLGVSGAAPTQAAGACPTNFNPSTGRQRLRFAFAIGQAF